MPCESHYVRSGFKDFHSCSEKQISVGKEEREKVWGKIEDKA